MRRPPLAALALVLSLVSVAPALALRSTAAVAPPDTSHLPHPPIVVVGAGALAVGNGITGGSGTATDPYIIQGWSIDTRASAVPFTGNGQAVVGTAILIQDTAAHILVRDNVVAVASGTGIAVRNAPNVVVSLNEVVLDAPPLAVSPSSTARLVGISVEGDALVRDNVVRATTATASEVVGVQTDGGAPTLEWNVIRSAGSSLTSFTGLHLEGGSPTARGNVIQNVGPGTTTFNGVFARRTITAVVEDNAVVGAWAVGAAGESAGAAYNLPMNEHLRLRRNSADGVLNGILLTGGSSSVLTNNVLEDVRIGILLRSERGASVHDNTVVDASYGFGIYGTLAAHYRHVGMTGNTVNGSPVVVMRALKDTTVDGAALGPVAFFAVLESRNVVVHDLAVAGGAQGVLLGDVTNVRVDGARITGTYRAVEATASMDVTFDDVNGGNAILNKCNYCTIKNSTLTGGPGGASAQDPLISDIRTTSSYAVAILEGSSGATVRDVTAREADIGILVRSVTHLHVAGSLLTGNGVGLEVTWSDDVKLRHNAIESNGVGLSTANTVVDARENWWGHTGGPSVGNGVEAVGSGVVLVSPWLSSAPAGAGDKT